METKLTTEQIAADVKAIGVEIKELKDQIEVLQLKRRQLQSRCTHPHGYQYTDRGGDRCFTCPDCGYDS